MHVLLYGRHRYPARRDDASGLRPRPDPSGAPAAVSDILARGLAEEGVRVDYLLPAGVDAPLPEGVRHVTRPTSEMDVFHNLRVDGRPWVVTVHGYRPPAGYFDRWSGDELVADPARLAPSPYAPVPNAIFVSGTLARSFGGRRHVLNGLDPDEYVFSAVKRDYLLFMAGMQGPAYADAYRRKGLDVALALSRAIGFELVVAGAAREPAVGERIAELCRDHGASYLGDVRGARKAELLAGARALLFPTRLHEGCPLIVIEALMSGTPVIASDRGSCPELIPPEVGFVCAAEPDFRRAIENVGSISPHACRDKAVTDFHYRRMATGYIREYERERAGAQASSRASRL